MSPQAASKARMWTILAAFIAVVVIALGGMLGVQPLLQATSEANEAAADQESRNDAEQVQVNKLKEQFAKIDEYRDELAALRVQVPTTLETQEFQRQLAAMVAKHDIVVSNLTFGTSSEVTVTNAQAALAATPVPSAASGAQVTTPPPAAAPAEGEAESDAPVTKTPEQIAAEEGAKRRFTNFYTVPVTIGFSGPYREVLALVRELQTTQQRLILVSKVSGSVGGDAGEAAQGGGVSQGDLSLTVEGQISVLLDPESKTALPEDETIDRPSLPSTEGKDNPLLGG